MKILIVGTGVIGSLYATALSEKHEVIHYVRKNKFNSFNFKTIEYDLLDERKSKKEMNQFGNYTYKCVTEVDDSYDLIIVPVKSYQLLDALKELKDRCDTAKFLLMSLDWNMHTQIEDLLSIDQFIYGYAGGGGTFVGDKLYANLGNDVMLGAIYPEQNNLLNEVKRIFESCQIIPEIQENPLHWLWIHNIGSAPMGLALTKYKNMDEFIKDKKMVKMSFKAMRECYEICRHRNVDIKKYGEVKMINIPLWILYPMFKLNMQKNPAMKRYTLHAMESINEMVLNARDIYQTGIDLELEMPNMEELIDIANQSDN